MDIAFDTIQGKSGPDSPAQAASQLIEGMRPGWVLLQDCHLGDAGAAPVRFALIHPEIGVALVDLAPALLPDAIVRLRQRLEAARFASIFPGHLPIVHRALPARQLRQAAALIDYAFALEPRLSLPGGGAWTGTVFRALDPAPVVAADPATPAPPSRTAPEPASQRVAASRRQHRPAGLLAFWALLAGAIGTGGLLLAISGPPPSSRAVADGGEPTDSMTQAASVAAAGSAATDGRGRPVLAEGNPAALADTATPRSAATTAGWDEAPTEAAGGPAIPGITASPDVPTELNRAVGSGLAGTAPMPPERGGAPMPTEAPAAWAEASGADRAVAASEDDGVRPPNPPGPMMAPEPPAFIKSPAEVPTPPPVGTALSDLGPGLGTRPSTLAPSTLATGTLEAAGTLVTSQRAVSPPPAPPAVLPVEATVAAPPVPAPGWLATVAPPTAAPAPVLPEAEPVARETPPAPEPAMGRLAALALALPMPPPQAPPSPPSAEPSAADPAAPARAVGRQPAAPEATPPPASGASPRAMSAAGRGAEPVARPSLPRDARPPDSPAPVAVAASPRCRAITLRIQLGEELTNADRSYLRGGCGTR